LAAGPAQRSISAAENSFVIRETTAEGSDTTAQTSSGGLGTDISSAIDSKGSSLVRKG
jgi:hypothetical protein